MKHQLIIFFPFRYNNNIMYSSDHIRSCGWNMGAGAVLSAMVISSMGGKILNNVIIKFPDIAVFQPVINGVAGNLVGIQASRISTELHRTSKLGKLPKDLKKQNLRSPSITFLTSSSSLLSNNATAARALLFLVVPGHLLFNWFISLSQGSAPISPLFMVCYLLAALLQVGLLLHVASVLVYLMWDRW